MEKEKSKPGAYKVPMSGSAIPHLKQNPATDASMAIISAMVKGAAIPTGLDELFKLLPPCGTTLTGPQLELAAAFWRTRREALDAAKAINAAIKKTTSQEARQCNFANYGTPQLYPNNKSRGGGTPIEDLNEVGDFPAICSHDVLQQTPEVLDIDNDQSHVVENQSEVPTNKMPSGLWKTSPIPLEGLIVDTFGATKVYTKINTCENVGIHLKQLTRPLLDACNTVIGSRDAKGVRVDSDAIRATVNSAKKFQRHGKHTDIMLASIKFDDISPKIDGEPLHIDIPKDSNVGMAYTRNGATYEVTINSDKRTGKPRRLITMLEFFPSVDNAQRIFATHITSFGITNYSGRKFTRALLDSKTVNVSVAPLIAPPYCHLLELPTFDNVSPPSTDGVVVHSGNDQYFIKRVRTVDIKTDKLKQQLTDYGFIADWEKDGLWEYAISHDVPTCPPRLTPLRQRVDKINENRFENIVLMANAPDFHAWLELLQSQDLDVPPAFGGLPPINGKTPLVKVGLDDFNEEDDDYDHDYDPDDSRLKDFDQMGSPTDEEPPEEFFGRWGEKWVTSTPRKKNSQ